MSKNHDVFKVLVAEPHINGLADIICISGCIAFSIFLVVHIVNLYKIKEKAFYFGLYFFHLFITSYYYYITKNAYVFADSAHYYLRVITPESYYDPVIRFSIGTQFIKYIVWMLYEGLNFSYLSCFILFSTLGFTGMIIFMKVVHTAGFRKSLKFKGIYFFPLLLLLPNIHMWTVALGKDSLIFFGIMSLTYSLIKIKKRYLLFILSSFIIIMIRPHVFVLVTIALFLTLLLWSDLSPFVKLPVLVLVLILGYFSMNFLMSIVFKTSFSIQNVVDILDERTGYYAKNDYKGSVVDTSSYPFLFKVFSYLYRPIFEKINFNYIMVSIDNVFSLFFSLVIFSRKFIKWISKQDFYLKFSFMFFIVAVSLFASIFSNFGIAVRQKTMFIFSLYTVALPFAAWKYEEKKKKRSARARRRALALNSK